MKPVLFPTILIGMLQMLLPGAASPFCFEEAGSAYSLSPHLLESIARVESGMNPAAINHNSNGSNDVGLMQINSSWIGPAHLDREQLISDPCYNIRTGAGILRGCIDRHGYSWQAVGCYNATSEHKRKAYAWKVFRQLAAHGTGDRQMSASTETTVRDDKQNNSSMTVRFEEREASPIAENGRD